MVLSLKLPGGKNLKKCARRVTGGQPLPAHQLTVQREDFFFGGGRLAPRAVGEIGEACLRLPALKARDKLTFSLLSAGDGGASSTGQRDAAWHGSPRLPDGK